MIEASKIAGKTLTVRELIAELKNQDQDAHVVIGSDYGDRSHTQQALFITEVMAISTDDLYESHYSHSRVAVTKEDRAEDHEDDDADQPEPQPVCYLL